MPSNKNELTPKQRRFVEFYANPKSETYAQGIKSYIAAGYRKGSSNAQAASRLLSTAKIVKELSRYTPDSLNISLIKRDISKDYALSKLQQTYDNAEEKGDTTNQVACVRLMMQYNGLLSERVVIDIKDSRQLEDNHRAEAKRIASIITSSVDLPLLTQSGNESDVSGVDESIEAQFAAIPDKVDEERESTVPSDNDENRYSASVGPSGLGAVSVEFNGGLEAQDIVGGGIKGQAIRAAVDAAVDEVVG